MKPNIVLIGFMGSGKTEVGRRLAEKLGRRFVDTDTLVGVSIPEIFASEGEEGFRRRERDAVRKAARSTGAVIATGGGVVEDEANVATLGRTGAIVYLRAGPDELARRLRGVRDRPLLSGPGRRRDRIAELLARRAPLYEAAADVVVDVDGLGPDEVADEALRRLALVRSVRVALDPPYRVLVGRGLLERASALLPIPASAEKACIVSHPRIRRQWAGALEGGLADSGLSVAHATFGEGEARKTMETAASLHRRLASAGMHRGDVLIALGGGVVGDVGGFVASTYNRGIPVIQVPTTLLAMVDAAIGGKTGVNLPEGKNLVGTFHQPLAVLADLDTLATLPARELRGGLAEVVKYACIADPSLGDLLLASDADDALAEIVLRSAAIKADVVASDERESGRRAILNYGHTLGHALETMSLSGKLPRLHHGEAIAIGMVFAAWVSVALGLADKDLVAHHATLLRTLGLPVRVPGRPRWSEVERTMGLDKKYAKGLRLVLLSVPGAVAVRGDIPSGALREAWARVTEG